MTEEAPENTGGSTGPHLHFDFPETDSTDSVQLEDVLRQVSMRLSDAVVDASVQRIRAEQKEAALGALKQQNFELREKVALLEVELSFYQNSENKEEKSKKDKAS